MSQNSPRLQGARGLSYAGQAVVEYSGALVISAGLMALAIGGLSGNLYGFFVTIQEQVFSFLLKIVQGLT